MTRHVPVVVVGAGPVGATAANLLGRYGVSTLLVDRLDARIVKIIESRAGARARAATCTRPRTTVVEDIHNGLRPWFTEHRCRAVLVRPDRYVAAAGQAADIGPELSRLAARFLPGGQR